MNKCKNKQKRINTNRSQSKAAERRKWEGGAHTVKHIFLSVVWSAAVDWCFHLSLERCGCQYQQIKRLRAHFCHVSRHVLFAECSQKKGARSVLKLWCWCPVTLCLATALPCHQEHGRGHGGGEGGRGERKNSSRKVKEPSTLQWFSSCFIALMNPLAPLFSRV